jgi:leader peptidase (prepilin peptidase)/N-methyltransferase
VERASEIRPGTSAGAGRTAIVGLLAFAGALASLLHFGPGLRGLVGAGFLAVLAVLASIDLDEHRLPDRIVLPSAAVALAVQTAGFPDRAPEWALASVGTSLALLVLVLIYPAGLGFGDVKLALLLGAVLGKTVVLCLVVACLSIFPVALFILLRHGPAARRRAIPFGPFLAAGAAVALLATS